jgi:nitrogen regulatory protein P-II 1
MKEIKAYVRTETLEKTVEALEAAGAPGITVTEVHPVGYGFDANYFTSTEEIVKRYWTIAKLEVVCADQDVERLVDVISRGACTRRKGDGMIFVSPVQAAVRIRTGERNEAAL